MILYALWKILVAWKIHRHLKDFANQKCCWRFQKYIAIDKIYTVSNITFPTTWYNDIVYADHMERLHAFQQHFVPALIMSPGWEKYVHFSRKDDSNKEQ